MTDELADHGPAQLVTNLEILPGSNPLIDGFYGASSMERLPTERAIKEQTQKFTHIRRE